MPYCMYLRKSRKDSEAIGRSDTEILARHQQLLEETAERLGIRVDAIYRETPEKVRRRKQQGCVCVDMECSANAAAARFRDKDLVQFFYAADNLDAEKWEPRSLSNDSKLEEKDRIAPGCAMCTARCGNTDDYDMERLWNVLDRVSGADTERINK